MKDPCDDCLVQVTCSILCDKKRNYAALIHNAIAQLQSQLRYGENIRKQYLKYLKLEEKQINSVRRIRIRKQRLKKIHHRKPINSKEK